MVDADDPKPTDPGRLRALEHAIRTHDRFLVRWLARKFNNPDLARDIAQETYLRAWRYAQETPIEDPKALLFRTAANLAANEFAARRRARLVSISSSDSAGGREESVPANDPSPEETASDRCDARLAAAAIDALPSKVRRAFVLSRFEDKSYEEIAADMSMSVSSVEKYIITALQRLREALGRKYEKRGNGAAIDLRRVRERRSAAPKDGTNGVE